MLHATGIHVLGGDMVVSDEELVRRVAGKQAVNNLQTKGLQCGDVTHEPTTEVSDKDYRSFCLPCATLEATDE